MPLLKKKLFSLAGPPEDLKPDELVYQVRFTGEVFRNYEEYLARINMYRRRVWTCKGTGEGNLTFEEALASELKCDQRLQTLPTHFMAPVLHMVQFSRDRLEDLSDLVYKTFKECYVEGEEVGAWREGDVYRCRVVRVLIDTNGEMNGHVNGRNGGDGTDLEPSILERKGLEVGQSDVWRGDENGGSELGHMGVRKSEGGEEERSGYEYVGALMGLQEKADRLRYEVGWLSAETEEIMLTTIENPGNLMRRRYPLTKGQVKAFIRESAVSSRRNGVWKVHEHLAERFGIRLKPPEGFLEAVKKVKKKKKEEKAKQEQIPEEVKGGAGEDGEEKVEEETEGVTAMEVDEDKESRKTRKKKRLADDMVEGDDLRKRTWKRRKQINKQNEKTTERHEKTPLKKPRKRMKYPIEDTLVEPSPEDPLFPARPRPSKDFLLPAECVGELLAVWDFCCTYGKALRLSPFSLEDLELSLGYEGPVPLLGEMHTALLRVVILGNPGLSEQYRKQGRKASEISVTTWQEDICAWIGASKQESLLSHVPSIRKRYSHLPADVKLAILQNLVDMAVGTEPIREHIDECEETFQELLAQRREEGLEGRGGRYGEGEGEGEHGDLVDEEHLNRNDVECEESDEGVERNACRDGQSASWQTKGKRKVNCFRSQRSFSDSHLVENGGSERPRESLRVRSRHLSMQQATSSKLRETREQREEDRLQAERSREQQDRMQQQKRREYFARECEKCSVRVSSLGRDRECNRYWFFPREGRLFVEGADAASWGFYGAVEEMNDLHGSLNPKGIRERDLKKQLEKLLPRISAALSKRTKEMAQKLASEEATLRRSTRVRTAPRMAPFLNYVNKFAG